VLAQGQYKGYTQSYAATVTDGVLSFVARDRQDLIADPYGMSLSAMQIVSSATSALQFSPPPQLPAAMVGTLYQYQFSASGGVTPYAFSAVNGSLPPSLQLSSQGLLSGTPTQDGMYTCTVQVCDSTLRSLSVSPAPAPSR
jgi:hypothetical protein